jgi:hypothetical protein
MWATGGVPKARYGGIVVRRLSLLVAVLLAVGVFALVGCGGKGGGGGSNVVRGADGEEVDLHATSGEGAMTPADK